MLIGCLGDTCRDSRTSKEGSRFAHDQESNNGVAMPPAMTRNGRWRGDEVAVNRLDRSAMGDAGRRFEEVTGQEDVAGGGLG